MSNNLYILFFRLKKKNANSSSVALYDDDSEHEDNRFSPIINDISLNSSSAALDGDSRENEKIDLLQLWLTYH